jgi:hypothetical protein
MKLTSYYGCRVLEYGKPSNNNKFTKDAVTTYLKLVELGKSDTRK